MQLFEHVTDYGPAGMARILPSQLVAQRTTIWGPSKHYLDRAYQLGHYPCDALGVLNLVRAGHLAIMGREWWLTDRAKRAHFARTHEWAKWDESFDGEIAVLAEEQRSLPVVADRSVVIAPEERGDEIARQLVTNPEASQSEAWLRLADHLLAEGRHGLALTDKVKKAVDENDRRRVILRDLLNHRHALRDSRADVALIDSDDADLYALGVVPPVKPELPDRVDLKSLAELLRLLSALNEGMDSKRLFRLLDSTALADARAEAQQLLKPGKVASNELRRALLPFAKEMPWSDVVLGGKDANRPLQITGLILTLASSVGLQSGLLTFVSLSVAAEPSARASLRKAKAIRPSYDNGMVLPFLAAKKIGKPTVAELGEAIRVLDGWELPSE